jgi:signal transduction histidine kinase
MSSGRYPRKLRSALDRVLVHDVKNMGFRLQMLLMNLEEHYGDPEFKKLVQSLLHSTVERLEAIAGRYEAHQDAILVKVALNPNDILGVVAREASARIPRLRGVAGGHPPKLAVSLGAPPEIWGDPDYLKEAVANFVDNALEAAGSGGKVLLRSMAAGARSRPRARVEIIDNGAGMTPEFLRDRLARPFETTKPDGVGLGLFTASQIVRYHGGTLRVLSQPGGGTIIRLSFPAAHPSP